MRCLKRNKQMFYYCNPDGDPIDVCDEFGNMTGEHIQLFTTPAPYLCNVSPSTGVYRTEEFGSIENYDHVLLTDDMNCPITEKSVLFLEKEPSKTIARAFRAAHVHGRDVIVSVSYDVPVYDYVVWRVSKSLNYVAIAIKRANVGPGDESEVPYDM